MLVNKVKPRVEKYLVSLGFFIFISLVIFLVVRENDLERQNRTNKAKVELLRSLFLNEPSLLNDLDILLESINCVAVKTSKDDNYICKLIRLDKGEVIIFDNFKNLYYFQKDGKEKSISLINYKQLIKRETLQVFVKVN